MVMHENETIGGLREADVVVLRQEPNHFRQFDMSAALLPIMDRLDAPAVALRRAIKATVGDIPAGHGRLKIAQPLGGRVYCRRSA